MFQRLRTKHQPTLIPRIRTTVQRHIREIDRDNSIDFGRDLCVAEEFIQRSRYAAGGYDRR